MSFYRFKRQTYSPTSSTSLSPTGPVMENPITFQALAARIVPDVSLRKKKKQRKPLVLPSMFLEEDADDEDTPPPKLVRVSSADEKTDNAARTNGGEAQARKNKTQYFDGIFNNRGPEHSSASLLANGSIVVVEIKISTRVKEDEAKLVSDLTFRLAQVYQRPENFMMVTIQQDVCLHFGNSDRPAYLMKIFAHPYLIAPITNLRNTIFIQKALHEFLDIAPNRGVIIYAPVPEENLATDGVTMLGDLVRLERDARDSSVFKSISRSMSRKLKSSSSSPRLSVATSSCDKADGSHETTSVSDKDGHVKESSGEGDQSQSVRKSKSLRDFVYRRVGDRGSEEEKK